MVVKARLEKQKKNINKWNGLATKKKAESKVKMTEKLGGWKVADLRALAKLLCILGDTKANNKDDLVKVIASFLVVPRADKLKERKEKPKKKAKRSSRSGSDSEKSGASDSESEKETRGRKRKARSPSRSTSRSRSPSTSRSRSASPAPSKSSRSPATKKKERNKKK